jgi:hypothetical protein
MSGGSDDSVVREMQSLLNADVSAVLHRLTGQ